MPKWLVAVWAGLAVLVVLWAPRAHATPRRVGVIVVGDATGAARLGETLQQRIGASAALELVVVAHVARPWALSAPLDAPLGVPLGAPWRARLDRAIEQFYAGALDGALADLDELGRVIEGAIAGAPPESISADRALRTHVALWKAAVLERKWTDRGRAEPVPDEVRAAVHHVLRLDPDVQIGMDTFWPRFAELVEAERRALPRHTLSLRELPAAARLWLDGRPIGRRAEVYPGRYQLVVAADGHVPSTETLDVQRDLELTRRLAPSVTPELAAELDEAVRLDQRARAADRARRVPALAAAEVLVVVAVAARDGRAMVARGSSAARSPKLTEAALVAWIARALAAPPSAPRWELETTARLGIAASGTTLSWGQSRIAAERTGGGLWLSASARQARWQLGLDLRLDRDAAVQPPSARAVAPAPTTSRAGWAGTAQASVSTRLGGERISLLPRLRLVARSHRPGELVFPEGPDPLTSSFTSWGLGLGATVWVRLPMRASLEAAITFDPLAGYLEAPAIGGTTNPPEAASGTALIAIELGVGWSAEFGIAYDRIELQHVGGPSTQLTPAPVDARRLDEASLFWIGGRRAW